MNRQPIDLEPILDTLGSPVPPHNKEVLIKILVRYCELRAIQREWVGRKQRVAAFTRFEKATRDWIAALDTLGSVGIHDLELQLMWETDLVGEEAVQPFVSFDDCRSVLARALPYARKRMVGADRNGAARGLLEVCVRFWTRLKGTPPKRSWNEQKSAETGPFYRFVEAIFSAVGESVPKGIYRSWFRERRTGPDEIAYGGLRFGIIRREYTGLEDRATTMEPTSPRRRRKPDT